MSIVYDYYATGDRSRAKIYATNQTLKALHGLLATVSLIALDGIVKYSNTAAGIEVAPVASTVAMEIPKVAGLGPAFFVRCRLSDSSGGPLADNVYWQSATPDDVGPPGNDRAFNLNQVSWADFTELNHMERATVEAAGTGREAGGMVDATVTLTNRSKSPAFFMRAEIVKGRDGDEILPILWDDNYITVFSGESVQLHARYKSRDAAGQPEYLRLEGHNVRAKVMSVERR